MHRARRFVLGSLVICTGMTSPGMLRQADGQDGQTIAWEQRDYGWLPGRLMEFVGVKPTVVGNLLYVLSGPLTGEPEMSSEAFIAVDCATGKTKWKSEARFGPTKHELGIAASAGVLYLLDRDVAKLIAEARMYGIDQKTGRELWKKNLKVSLLGEVDPGLYEGWPTAYPYPDNFLALDGAKGIVSAASGGGYSSSLIYPDTGDPLFKPDGGGIIWYYDDKRVVYTARDKIKAVDLASGAELWSRDLPAPPQARPGTGDAMAIGTTIYVMTTANKLYKFDAVSGSVLLEKSLEGKGYDAFAFEGKTVLVSSSDGKGNLVAVDHASNQELWKYPNPGRGYSVHLAANGTICYASSEKGGGLHVLRADRGEKLWSSPLKAEGIAAHDDRVFVSSEKSVIALDRSTGKELWRFDDRWPVRFPVAVDTTTGVVYHGSSDKGGFIYALDGASGKEIWRHKLENTPSLCPLIVAGGSVLYRQLDDKKYGIIRALKAAPKP
ncbi:MAG: hypothetical protein EXS64_02520 [Candidatus Latescibacteria bacterium]|nr:hypothetical protein [Candidatus Latescibacterota bacterium]